MAFRTFRKNKWVSLINVVGLAVGMSAALVIFLVARYDLTFDRFELAPTGSIAWSRIIRLTGRPGCNPGFATPCRLRQKAR